MKIKLAQNVLNTSFRIAAKTESMAIRAHAVMPNVQSALPALYKIPSQPLWYAAQKSIEPLSAHLPSLDLSNIAHGASSMSYHFLDAFTQAQKEKEARAEDMMGPVVREIARKTSEVLSSPEEQTKLHEGLSSAKDQFNEHKKQINNIKNTASLIQKAIGSELADVLKNKIDSNTLNTFCKALKFSSKIATQAIPALRVLNNLFLAYEAAKTLYPEQAREIESYLINTLQPQEKILTQGLPDATLASEHDRDQCKQALKNSLDEYDQYFKDQTSEPAHKTTEPKDDPNPSDNQSYR